jgi:hypothetical protein
VNISDGLIAFGGAPANSVVVNNTVAPTTTITVGGAAIPVSLVNGATAAEISIAGTPIKKPAAGAVTFPNGGSLIRIDGPTTRVTISGQ